MQTDKIQVGSDTADMNRAMKESEKFAQYFQLGEQSSLRLQLLTEELLALPRAIVGEFYADFWLESTKNHTCQLHLDLMADMDYVKKHEMIHASTNRKNAASQGFLGALREMVEDALFLPSAGDHWQSESSANSLVFYGANRTQVDISWTLSQYRAKLENAKENDDTLEAAWNELKKSMLAKIADDVQIFVNGNQVHLVVKKTFPEMKIG